MNNGNPELQKQKNRELSIVLIVVNTFLAAILYNSVATSHDSKVLVIPVVIWVATLLIGIYVFTYTGKGHKLARWIFGVLLLISIVLIALTLYITALAGAFKN